MEYVRPPLPVTASDGKRVALHDADLRLGLLVVASAAARSGRARTPRAISVSTLSRLPMHGGRRVRRLQIVRDVGRHAERKRKRPARGRQVALRGFQVELGLRDRGLACSCVGDRREANFVPLLRRLEIRLGFLQRCFPAPGAAPSLPGN